MLLTNSKVGIRYCLSVFWFGEKMASPIKDSYFSKNDHQHLNNRRSSGELRLSLLLETTSKVVFLHTCLLCPRWPR